jgi:tripartite ATP-independent transporter DctM subunit
MIFAGMSGAATADVAGLGIVEMKMMTEAGYDKKFSAAITAASSTIGPIIPPSVPFVIYGSLAQVSVGRLFLGGAIPGILIGLYLIVAIYLIAKRRNYARGEPFSFKRFLYAVKDSIFELITPIIIVGGITTGFFTPTEAAVIAIAYAFILEVVMKKEIPLREIPRILLDAGRLTGIIMFIVATAKLYNWILLREKTGEILLNALLAITTDQTMIIFILMVGLIVLGCFVEPISCIIISVPVLAPFSHYIGMDPVHQGVFIVLAVMIGNLTPPVGVSMFIMCAIAEITIWEFFKSVLPFFIAIVLVLITIAYLPDLTLFLPNLLMGQ